MAGSTVLEDNLKNAWKEDYLVFFICSLKVRCTIPNYVENTFLIISSLEKLNFERRPQKYLDGRQPQTFKIIIWFSSQLENTYQCLNAIFFT